MHIVFVGPPFMDDLFSGAMAALEGEGHRTTRFTDPTAFAADTATLPTADIVVAIANFPLGGAIMDRAPNLRAIISPVTGTEGFDEAAATERGILVANGQIEENYTSMGEAAVMLALATLYDLHGTEQVMRQNLPRPNPLRAHTMMGKTVGIIGFGKIGQVIASRLSTWKARLTVAIRHPRALPDHVTAVPLDRLLAESDVVILAAALDAETRGMLSLDRLRTMKPGVVFVNIARGGIAADADLAKLAAERPDMRLAIDVFEQHPPAPDNILRGVSGAILTPHMVGHTVETHDRLPDVLLENIRAAIAGRPPAYLRNPQALDAWIARLETLK